MREQRVDPILFSSVVSEPLDSSSSVSISSSSARETLKARKSQKVFLFIPNLQKNEQNYCWPICFVKKKVDLKFVYSEKATTFCKISTLLLSTVNNYRHVTGMVTGENFAFFIYRHFVEIL